MYGHWQELLDGSSSDDDWHARCIASEDAVLALTGTT